MKEMQSVADSLQAEGRKGYPIVGGASSPLGALGYVACAEEIVAQAFDMGIQIDSVICATGSAGTHSGLLAGFWGDNSDISVVGINVSRTKEAQEKIVFDLTTKTVALLGARGEVPPHAVECFADYVGPGYSLPTEGMVEAVKMLARTEAVLLDPVYTDTPKTGHLEFCLEFGNDEALALRGQVLGLRPGEEVGADNRPAM